jgi:hypothetical protein
MRVLGRAAAAAGLLLCSGCFKSYVVVSFEPGAQPAPEEQIAATPALEPARATLRKLAVRGPYGCSAEGGAPAGGAGVAMRSETVLRARCELWLAELAKAFAERYEVVSGPELAEAERSEGGALAAARKLGADALVLVNELATVPLLVSAADPAATRLAAADPRGEASGPAELSKDAEASVRRVVEARFPDGAVAGLAAAAEVTVVSTSSGELLWTYHRRFADRLTGTAEARVLLRGRSGTWRPVLPRGAEAAPGPETPGAGEDPLRARLRQLGAALASDVAARFSHPGQGGTR